jgi:hypothetical protein
MECCRKEILVKVDRYGGIVFASRYCENCESYAEQTIGEINPDVAKITKKST